MSQGGDRSGAWDGQERRGLDAVTSLLAERMDGIERRAESTGESLDQHVRGCEKMQKRVLLVGCFILVWIVAHSPEAARLVDKLLPALLK